MSRVEINMVEGDHSMSQKLAFMKKATEAVVRILHCSPEDVRVTILEYKRENVSRAGTSVLESG
jgi:phenylpyruvate tautomerase PptA (4-oxalocrotonate tautomerase family)